MEGYKENSIEAISKVTESFAPMVEFDVQIFKKSLISFHDEHGQRLLEIPSNLDAFSERELFLDYSVPRLNQIFQEVPEELAFNIEFKCPMGKEGEFVDLFVPIYKSLAKNRRVLVSSFNPIVLFELKQALPEIPRALLVTWQADPHNSPLLKSMALLALSSPHLIHFDHNYLDEELIQLFKEKNLKVAAWVVNKEFQMKKLLRTGVDSIITDRIDLLKSSSFRNFSNEL